MADVLGAWATCGMVGLIVFLIGSFLAEIGKVRREMLMGLMKVYGITCLFTAAEYGGLLLIRVMLFDGNQTRQFADLVQHSLFAKVTADPHFPAHYGMAVSLLLTALAGCLFFLSMEPYIGEKAALGRIAFMYMLPGMELAFLPGGLAGILVLLGAVTLGLRKKIRWAWKDGKRHGAQWMAALFGMMKLFVLYGFAVGV